MIAKLNNFDYINNVLKRSSLIIDEYNERLVNENEYAHINIISDLKKSEEKLNIINYEKIFLSLLLDSFFNLYKNKKSSICFYVDSFSDEYLDLIKESLKNYKSISFSISKNTHYFNGDFYQINLTLED